MENNKVININGRRRGIVFWSYYKMYARLTLQSPLNMFLGLYLNIIIMVAWLAFKQGDSFLLSSIIGTSVVRNGMYTFFRSLVNTRRTRFSELLHALPTSKRMDICSAVSWNLTLNIAISMILIAIAIAFMPQQFHMFLHVNWAMYLSGYLLLWISSVAMVYMLLLFFRNPDTAQSVAIIIYVIAYTFFGLAFPFSSIAKFHWLNGIMYIFPQRYALNIMQAGWVNAKNMIYVNPDPNSNESIDWGFGGKLWIAYVASSLVIAVIVVFLIVYYIRDSLWRKKDKYGISVLHQQTGDYINGLKNASTIAELEQIRKEYRKNTKAKRKMIYNKKMRQDAKK